MSSVRVASNNNMAGVSRSHAFKLTQTRTSKTKGLSNKPGNSFEIFIHDRYTVERILGSGTFGYTYLVKDANDNNKRKVLKQIEMTRTSEDPRKLKQIYSKYRADTKRLIKMDHLSVVCVYEYFREDSLFFFTSEFIDGYDLSKVLAKLKRMGRFLDETQILDWAVQLNIGLHYLHTHGVLHRNIKPSNLFLRGKRRLLKIGDPANSLAYEDLDPLVTSLRYLSNASHLAPYALRLSGYTSKCDMWSAGCVIFDMCVLEQAFNGQSLMEVALRVLRGPIPDIPRRYSKGVGDIIKMLLVRDPSKRPSAAEFLNQPFVENHMKVGRAYVQGNELNRSDDMVMSYRDVDLHVFSTQWLFKYIGNRGSISGDDSYINTQKHLEDEIQRRAELEEKEKQELLEGEEEEDDVQEVVLKSLTQNRLRTPPKSKAQVAASAAQEAEELWKLTPTERIQRRLDAGEFASVEELKDYLDNVTEHIDKTKHSEKRGTSAKSVGWLGEDKLVSFLTSRKNEDETSDSGSDVDFEDLTAQEDLTASVDERADDYNDLVVEDTEEKIDDPPMVKFTKGLKQRLIKLIGKTLFYKAHSYLLELRYIRAEEQIPESVILNGLVRMIPRAEECFLVDQLLFLEVFCKAAPLEEWLNSRNTGELSALTV